MSGITEHEILHKYMHSKLLTYEDIHCMIAFIATHMHLKFQILFQLFNYLQ